MAKKKKDDAQTAEENGKVTEATVAEEKKEDNKKSDELAEMRDKFLRLAADFDNYKKHAAAEKDALRAVVVSDTVQMMLPILDNLERAVSSAKDDKSPLKEGVEMVLSKAEQSFTAFGITSFGERGEDFNPELHNAIMTCTDEELEAGKIADVMQKGYKMGDKIIRHALVRVSE